tara:strand:- start:1866 stop:2225 length:360 start_codon:yes stop_codon:yes gene_type:complete
MNKLKYLYKENRPWGRFFVLHDEPYYKIKRIEVEPSERLSYQFHDKRSETWVIVLGEATVTLDGNTKKYKVGETVLIPQGSKHRVENQEDLLLVFIEIQTGSYFGEDDIIRIEDDYNRK